MATAVKRERAAREGGRIVAPFIKEETADLLATVFGNPGAGARFLVETWPAVWGVVLGEMGGLFTEDELRLLTKAVTVKPSLEAPGSTISCVGMPTPLLTKINKLSLIQRMALEQWIAGGGVGRFAKLLKPAARGR